jgi:hypothetical protein
MRFHLIGYSTGSAKRVSGAQTGHDRHRDRLELERVEHGERRPV